MHPSRETATTIVASESRLVAAHVVYTLAWLLVLLGLPGLYAVSAAGMGGLGLVGFLAAFSGTYLIAVTGNFGFLAPVLAQQSAAVLDSISQYSPVVIINGLAAILFMIGYVPVRRRHAQNSDTASLGRNPGRCGRSGPLAGFRDRSAGFDRRLANRDLWQCEPRRRHRLARLPAVAHAGRFGCVASDKPTRV